MEKITSIEGLKEEIQRLEFEKTIKAQLLREQFHVVYESLKPANLVMSILKDVATSPNIIDNVINSAVGMATGYFSKKIVVGTSSNIIKNFLGTILQTGVTNVVSNHPDVIKSIGSYILSHIFPKKEEKTQNNE